MIGFGRCALAGVALAFFACSSQDQMEDVAQGGTSSSGGGSGGASGSAGTGTGAVSEPGLTYIQEDELGFSAVDGLILPRQGSTSITGYTGTGFADGNPGVGTTISWSMIADGD